MMAQGGGDIFGETISQLDGMNQTPEKGRGVFGLVHSVKSQIIFALGGTKAMVNVAENPKALPQDLQKIWEFVQQELDKPEGEANRGVIKTLILNLSKNENTPTEVLKSIWFFVPERIQNADMLFLDDVIQNLVENKSTPQEIIFGIASYPYTQADVLHLILTNHIYIMMYKDLRNPSLEILEALIKHPNTSEYTLATIGSIPSLPKETLARLMQHPNAPKFDNE